jgi:hypothetical protein
MNVFETGDGYKWKYMFNVDLGSFCEFAVEEYIPVKAKLGRDDFSDQWLVQQAAKDGAIACVSVIDGGSGYVDGEEVTITGSTGTGFLGTVVTDGGSIVRVDIDYLANEDGLGYRTEGTCVINTVAGVNAFLRTVVSPIGGHGSDAREELDGRYVMVKSLLNSDEGGTFPVGEEFRQIMLIKNPKTTELGMRLVLSAIQPDAPSFSAGVEVENDTNITTTINHFDDRTGIMYVSGETSGYVSGNSLFIDGNYVASIDIVEDNANLIAIAPTYAAADVIYGSGKIVYIENRVPIQRNIGQSEDIRLVIEF